MEKSIFTDFIGNCLRTRSIEYFLTWNDVPIIASDLVDSKVGNLHAAKKEIAYLLSEKFIKRKGKKYTLNNRNAVAKKSLLLFKAILKQEIPKLEARFTKLQKPNKALKAELKKSISL